MGVLIGKCLRFTGQRPALMINKPALLLQKYLARNHEVHEVAESVAIFSESGRDFVNLSAVDWLKVATSGVGEHFLGEATGEIRLAFEEHLLEGDDIIHTITIGQFGGGIDLRATVGTVMGAPATDRIKVLKGKAHGIDFAMATGAGFVFAVQLKLFADGLSVAQVR